MLMLYQYRAFLSSNSDENHNDFQSCSKRKDKKSEIAGRDCRVLKFLQQSNVIVF